MQQLAQVTVGRLRGPLDSPVMREFVTALDPVNQLAVGSPGFVWRLRSEHGHGVCVLTDDGGPVFVNLSVWQSYEALHAFVYRSAHGEFTRRRAQWFERTPQPSTALWWVAEGQRPTIDDAMRRLARLRAYGPTPRAFALRRRFDAEGRPVTPKHR